MVEHAGLFCGITEYCGVWTDAIAGKPALTGFFGGDAISGITQIIVGLAREGVRQSNPSLSGNSYSAATLPSAPGLPGLLSVGSFSRHSTR